MNIIEPTKNEAIILTHLGLGDHFLCNGMVRYLAQFYEKVYVVVKYNYYETVKKLYSDMSNIDFMKVNNNSAVNQSLKKAK